MKGIATNLPIMANAAKISDITKTAVDGGVRFISSPPSLLTSGL
jgi:hypothetical protein